MVERRRDVTLTATPEQRRAFDPAASVVVAASAGTGKTHVLTNRVLRLLLAGAAPGKLLCLTFTKAAAAEMANRINATLGDWARIDDEALHRALADLCGLHAVDDAMRVEARRLFARVLDDPTGLRIQTLHAFCQAVLARFPLEAQVPPHAQVLDERTAAELLLQARAELIEAVRAAPDSPLGLAFAEVTRHVEDQGFAALVDALVIERRRLLRLKEQHRGRANTIAATWRALGVSPDENEAQILADAQTDAALDRAAIGRAAQALLGGTDAEVQRGQRIRGFLEATDRAAGWEDYCDVFLTKDGEPRQQLVSKPTERHALGTDAALRIEQQRIVILLDRLKAIALGRASTALLDVTEDLFDRYGALKQRRGALDYDDLILRTRNLLIDGRMSPWVLYKLDGGIDHILIDEAQDTSPEQWELVRALSAEFFAGKGKAEGRRTVFAVGDAKQSIFSFQGADPQSFADWADALETQVTAAGRRFAGLPLALSFRSAPAVLRLVDRVFAGPARAGLGAAPISHQAFRSGAGGVVELWPVFETAPGDAPDPWAPPLERRDRKTSLDRLADHLVETIHGWIGREPLPSRGRSVRPGDIMLLVRRRNALLDAVVRGLKGRGVPVAGTDRMALTEQLAVMDLVALGRFLVMPDDDLSLAEVLKSPLFGLDDDDLFALAWNRQGSLWRTLQTRAAELPKYSGLPLFLSGMLARADYLPPHEFYAELLSARGGRRQLLARLGPDAADPLDEFLGQALAYERQHPPSLQGFLHWLERGETEVKRDPEQLRDEVRLMTVHGAKGLQAPIVILPDTCQVPQTRPGLLWTADAALWSPRVALDDPVAAAARAEAREAERREHNRLLYVALTRAEDRLYICGYAGPRGVAEGAWYRLVEQAMQDAPAMPWPDGRVARRIAEPQRDPPRPARDTVTTEPAPGLPAFATPARAEPVPPRPLAPSRPAGDEPAVRSPLAARGVDRFRRGRLLHQLLQGLPALVPATRLEAARRLLSSPIHDLSPLEIEAMAREAMAVLDDPAFAAVFGPQSAAELPIVGRVGNVVVAGQVDRLLVGDSEVLLVDFKSDRPPPAQADAVAPTYLRQMAAYAAVLRAIYPEKAIRAALLWTDGPRLMPLPDALLAAHNPV
jgi:ATP-dependent helicase/nuclease subunit A